MKKSLILVGMLAVGYANAQEGKVGINTDTPQATLEVLPTKKNLEGTTNEGIVAPKLTKARIANIAEANLVEGTLVYATDATYTGNNTKVAKITEKGYYYYNGTEWVKAGADNEAIWVKDGANARLDYPKSDYTTKYTEKGGYELIPADTKYTVISSTNSRLSEDGDIQDTNTFNKYLIRNSDIDLKNPSSNFDVEKKVVIIDADNAQDGGTGHAHQTIIPQGKNVLSGKFIRSLFVNTEHFGDAKIRTIEGIYGSAAVNGLNSSATNVRGGFFDAVSNSNADIDNMRGLIGRVRLNGTGKINSIHGIQSQITLRDGSTDIISSNIGTLVGLYIGYNSLGNARYTGTIDKVYDIYAEAAGNQELRNRTKEAYGFYIGGGHKTNFVAGKLGVGTTTPIAKLDVVNGSARIAGKYFHKTSSNSIPADTKEIITVRDVITDYQGTVTDAGTELETSRTYEIQLNAWSEHNHVDSRYIVFYDNIEKQWKSKMVSSRNFGTQLAIAPSGNQIEVWHNRSELVNTIRATIVSTNTNSDTGASLYSFGLDGAMTNLAGNVGVGTETPTEKLDVDGKIKATSLAGIGNRNVYADENGVLQVGSATSASTPAVEIGSTTGMQCNAENRGKMNFIPREKGGDVFGICMKNDDGNYYWGYMVGGNNPTNGEGAFGSGL